jgi:DNA-directed RNA polymerase-5 subunit 1
MFVFVIDLLLSCCFQDLSISMLKKVLKQAEVIRSSRSGAPNFDAHKDEATSLQSMVDQYLQVRGTTKTSRDVDTRYGVKKESSESTTKAWLEKMRTLFIRKGSGFSSRSVITGDAYTLVNQVGIPYEIAQRITFEERVSVHNMRYLQELVDNKLCLTYKDGSSTYSLREGSKGHTFLRPGQVVHRRIMDGDIVFINRPPTTHKHSLQALSVYVHDDHAVKINPLICGPLSADFDGDCVHLFYPQSLAAKAEVLELFSVEKQLLSSHSGNLNLQLTTDSLLSLKMMFKACFLGKSAAQQLAMFISPYLPQPALLKVNCFFPHWTAHQILQMALPACFNCSGERFLIINSNFLKVDFNRDVVASVINEILISMFFEKGSGAVLKFFNSLQPMLMENLFSEGFSVSLEDFSISRAVKQRIPESFKAISPLLCNLRSTFNELVELQVENHIRDVKQPVREFILTSSALGYLIDSKSDAAVTKVVQQIGFLGLQVSDRGKLYSKTLVEDLASHFLSKYPANLFDYPSAQYGLIQNSFFHGLDAYEEMAHSISTREVIVRSSRGLSEPGTLFKNLMAILRDVVICYDGTVRNVSSNSIIQFEYGVKVGTESQSLFPAGEPVGVLAATAMSNPAYKAVLDSTPSSNCSWDMMKVAIALCKFFILVEVYFAIFCSVMLQIFLNISFLFRKYFFAKLVSRMT